MSQENADGAAAPTAASPVTVSPGRDGATPHAAQSLADEPEGQGGAPAITQSAPSAAGAEPAQAAGQWAPRLRPWVRELLVLAGFLAAGVAVTWPRAAYITGKIPLNTDQAEYVWNMWWVAHQVVHLGNPWSTGYLAAPVGVPLGLDTLTPLLGLVMTPVTLVFGPSASYNLLAIVIPGLAGYAMYRAARLWVRTPVGAIAAGAFFGLSGMITFQDWYHEHTAAGCIFFPLALEAAVRLRRDPTTRRGVILGVVLGASMLVDQEMSLIALVVAALVVLPWLARRPGVAAWRASAATAVTGLVVASPQLFAMVQVLTMGHVNPDPGQYVKFAAELSSLFAPSPRLSAYGLTGLGSIYQGHTTTEALVTFGVVLSLLAVTGLAVSWHRRGARPFALLWLGCALLALGPTLYINNHQYVPLAQTWKGLQVSLLMPYTWLVRIPGLASFREADRFTLLGLVGAAMLAGAAVEWLSERWRPALVVVAVLGLLEAGWPSVGSQPTMPTALPALDRPIAADHSGSLVVDVPFAIYGIPRYGRRQAAPALVVATADGHRRVDSYTSEVPRHTIDQIRHHAFLAGLVNAEKGVPVSAAQVSAARRDLPGLHIGWLILWLRQWTAPKGSGAGQHYPDITRYLEQTGLQPAYRADGAEVYRPGP
ncbi:MAG TPA: hypothetical protein VGS19_13850 [Streptosporangiaceae bacterium]|nr:hypothetical protein [Streptosporangiaceae bacterium]